MIWFVIILAVVVLIEWPARKPPVKKPRPTHHIYSRRRTKEP